MQPQNYRPTNPLPQGVLDIYTEAFPTDERRPWTTPDHLRSFMSAHPQMRLRLLTDNGHTLALLIYWQLRKNLLYVEHLATRADTRGQGLGAHLLNSLLSMPDCDLLLEVEPPCDPLTRRRVALYTRLGLVLHPDIDYTQPPYSPASNPVKLQIMTTPAIDDTALRADILPALISTVYQN